MTETEKKIMNVWKDVFERDDIGIDDDFFEIGGDSLKAMRIYMQLTKETAEIEIDDFFECLTIRSIAKKVDDKNILKNNNNN